MVSYVRCISYGGLFEGHITGMSERMLGIGYLAVSFGGRFEDKVHFLRDVCLGQGYSAERDKTGIKKGEKQVT